MLPAWLATKSVCFGACGELVFLYRSDPRSSRLSESTNASDLLRNVHACRGAHFLRLARPPNQAGGSGKSTPRPRRLHVVGDGGRRGRLASLGQTGLPHLASAS